MQLVVAQLLGTALDQVGILERESGYQRVSLTFLGVVQAKSLTRSIGLTLKGTENIKFLFFTKGDISKPIPPRNEESMGIYSGHRLLFVSMDGTNALLTATLSSPSSFHEFLGISS